MGNFSSKARKFLWAWASQIEVLLKILLPVHFLYSRSRSCTCRSRRTRSSPESTWHWSARWWFRRCCIEPKPTTLVSKLGLHHRRRIWESHPTNSPKYRYLQPRSWSPLWRFSSSSTVFRQMEDEASWRRLWGLDLHRWNSIAWCHFCRTAVHFITVNFKPTSNKSWIAR